MVQDTSAGRRDAPLWRVAEEVWKAAGGEHNDDAVRAAITEWREEEGEVLTPWDTHNMARWMFLWSQPRPRRKPLTDKHREQNSERATEWIQRVDPEGRDWGERHKYWSGVGAVYHIDTTTQSMERREEILRAWSSRFAGRARGPISEDALTRGMDKAIREAYRKLGIEAPADGTDEYEASYRYLAWLHDYPPVYGASDGTELFDWRKGRDLLVRGLTKGAGQARADSEAVATQAQAVASVADAVAVQEALAAMEAVVEARSALPVQRRDAEDVRIVRRHLWALMSGAVTPGEVARLEGRDRSNLRKVWLREQSAVLSDPSLAPYLSEIEESA